MSKASDIAQEVDKFIHEKVKALSLDDYGDVLDEIESIIEGRQDGLKDDRKNAEDGEAGA